MNKEKVYNPSSHDVTVLLTTSDKYSDAWFPFLRCWELYCSNLDFPVVINSETKVYDTDNPNITTYLGKAGVPWSRRLKNCLKTIKTEYVLLCLEDYFIQSPMDENVFNAAFKTMEEDKSIGVIQFAIDISCRYDKEIIINNYFSPVPAIKTDRKTHNGRIYCVLSLYRTKYLSKLLIPSESPWEFEVYGTLRSRFFKEKVVREREDHKRCFNYLIEPKYGYGISRGKWLPKNKELFEKLKIDVDYYNLGVLSEEEWQQWVKKYEGKADKPKNERKHRTKLQFLKLLLTNPKEFFSILIVVLNKKKMLLKYRLKYRFPFIR